MAPDRFNDERFLLSLHKSAFGLDPAARLLVLGDQLGLPAAYQSQIEGDLVAADIIHFGFENSATGPVFKLYFEYASRFRRARETKENAASEILVHRAYKWSALDPAYRIVTTYHACPHLDTAGCVAALSDMGREAHDSFPHHVARDVIERARRFGRASDFLLLSVREEGTQRESFDVRLYDANIEINSINDILKGVGKRYRVEKFADAFLFGEKFSRLGHIAGGLGRDGGSFLSFYFGVTQWP